MIFKRLGVSLVGALVVVGGLFHFMWGHVLNSQNGPLKGVENFAIDFVRVKADDRLQTRSRKLPPKPKDDKKPPTPKKIAISEDLKSPTQPQMKMDMPKLDLAFKGNGPSMGQGGGGSSDGDALPLVRIEPVYPRRAAMEGKEGWVTLSFDITRTGAVTNVKVRDSKPKRIFNSAARRALLKWKYKPKMVEGKPVNQVGKYVRLDFKLEG